MRSVRKININNWFAAQTFMGGKTDKILCNNTRMQEIDGNFHVFYHGHDIAKFTPNHVVVNSCGYRTYTTKERLNQLIPSRFTLYQKNFVWYVWDRENDTTFNFQDGMVFDN